MKSRTSFFNIHILKKDITRFLPVWLLFSIYIGLSANITSFLHTPAENASSVGGFVNFSVIPNLIYALVLALTLFGDLFSAKMCNALHALPIRREGWFFTHVTAGLLFHLVPTLAVTLLSLPRFGQYGGYAFLWMAGSCLQFLFFFGLALLCVFCSGSRFGTLSLYGILNFLPLLIYSVVEIFYVPLLPGVELSIENFFHCTPVSQMLLTSYQQSDFQSRGSILANLEPESWTYLLSAAAVGILMAGIALLLYRRRHLERAGDLIAVHCLAPLYTLICSVGWAMLFYSIFGAFGDQSKYFALIVGLLVGYFSSRMLLNRTVKVLTFKSVGGFLLLLVFLGASLGMTHLDPLRIAYRIPDADQVTSCEIYVQATRYNSIPVHSRSKVRKIQDLHRELIRDHDGSLNPYAYDEYPPEGVQATVSYTLDNHKVVTRKYIVSCDSDAFKSLAEYMSSWEYLFGDKTPEELASSLIYATATKWSEDVYDQDIPREFFPALTDAIYADCSEGALAQGLDFHPRWEDDSFPGYDREIGELALVYPSRHFEGNSHCLYLQLYSSCTHTLALLEQIDSLDMWGPLTN